MMRRLLTAIGLGLSALAVLALTAVLSVWLLGGRVIAHTYDVDRISFAAPSDSAAIRAGERLARMRGCPGCHGQRLEGRVFFDEPLIARLVAPNLAALAEEYSDADLERSIRHGIKPSGRTVFAMPASMFHHLSDADLGAIIAYIRSMPVVDTTYPASRIGLLGRLGLLRGQYHGEAQLIDETAPGLGATPPATVLDSGRYRATTLCTECHGLAFRGDQSFGSPPLTVVRGYTAEQLARFLHSGVAPGDRELPFMSETARRRFVHLSGAEIAALYAFLSTLPSDSAATH